MNYDKWMWERIIENATISVSKLKFDELGSFKSKFSRNEASSLDLFKYLTSESSKAHFHTREEGVNSNSGEIQAARPHLSNFMASKCVFSKKCGFEPNLFNGEDPCSTSEEEEVSGFTFLFYGYETLVFKKKWLRVKFG